MRLDVHVGSRRVAQLYRDRDEYVVKYLPHVNPSDFISLTMPVREEPWRWPRDLHPFFRQNWLDDHKAELLVDWNLALERKPLNPIAPLE